MDPLVTASSPSSASSLAGSTTSLPVPPVTVSAEEQARLFNATVLAMAALAEPGESSKHIPRIQWYVRTLALRMRASGLHQALLAEASLDVLVQASAWHDIGNAGVPDRIQLKPGKLDESELEIIKTHPVMGRTIIDQIRQKAGFGTMFLDFARDIALGHQERWNGSGYPGGLVGDDIPVAARLMALADAYDALTSDRVYRSGVSHERAVELITQQRGVHFDPDVVDAFLAVQGEFAAIARRLVDTDLDFEKKIDYLAKAIAESP